MNIALFSRKAFTLALVGAITTGAIALVYQLTHQQIAKQQQQVLVASYQAVLGQHFDNDILTTCQQSTLDGSRLLRYQASRAQQSLANIYQVTTQQGYNGTIVFLVAITDDDEVLGLRVLSHKETPGLGDKIELSKSDWVLDFAHKHWQSSQQQLWAVRKDGGQFDAFTGATITPRAIVNQLANLLNQRHQLSFSPCQE